MITTTTSETIEILLASNVTTTQASFQCSFNEISTTTLTPFTINGTTNNTTPVTIMSSPSSGNQRQLREFILENNDTTPITVTVRYNNTSVTRTIFYTILQINDSLIFNMESGWGIYDNYGQKKYDGTHIVGTGNIRIPEFTFYANIISNSTLAPNISAISLGKAERAYSAITISHNVTTQGAGITWAELAIYKVAQPMGIGTQQQHFRLGFADTSGVWNSTGRKATTITLTGCKEGDDLYVMFGYVATTTNVIFRSGNIADPLSSMLRIANTTGGNTWRPSRTEQFFANSLSNTTAGLTIGWQGI